MEYILVLLLLVTSFVVFKVYKNRLAAKQKLQRASERRKKSTFTSRPKNEYHAVKVIPCDNSCHAALLISEKIFLAKDVPRLPLDSCDRILDCQCRFAHYDDRRQNNDEDRRSSSSVLQDVFVGNENRKQKKRGRRKSDWI